VKTVTYSIAQPTAALLAFATSTAVSCFGGSNGTVNSIATGGTSPYNYNWLPGNFSGQTISNLTAGSYTMSVRDIQNCITTTTISVIEPTQIILTTSSINSNCGLANGQASVSPNGGTGAYTYLWLPSGGTNATALNLISGTYSIQVIDANSCINSTTVVVANNPAPTVTVSSTTSVSCNSGNNATATASVSGGIGPYTYTWIPNGGNAQIATGLSVGIYTLNVTTSNGCVSSAISPTIIQPTQLFSNILTTNVSCFNGANGSATVTAGGGIPGYTYKWLPGATTGSVVTGLIAGNYSVEIKDANNCVYTSTYSITQPTLALTVIATATAISCFSGNNGLASANALGGTAPYSFVWMPISINSSTIGGLSLGTYTVNVTDFKNCTTITTINVSQPTQSLSATANSIPTSCFGGSDGTATVSPVGGNAGYSYQWSPFGGSGQTANSLTPGTYVVTVSDANNCQTNVSVIISAPTIVTASLTNINPACNVANGSIVSQISGGIGPYTYSWSPGNLNTSSINGLLPNTYT
jgi:hypothetical protein